MGGCLLLKTHHICTYEDNRSLHSHRSTIYNRISSLHSGSLTQSLLNPWRAVLCLLAVDLKTVSSVLFFSYICRQYVALCTSRIKSDQLKCVRFTICKHTFMFFEASASRGCPKKESEKKNTPQLATASRFFSSLYIGCVNQLLILIFRCFLWAIYPKRTLCKKIMCVSCKSLRFDVASTHQHYLIHSAHSHWSVCECV